jgi:predicted porin
VMIGRGTAAAPQYPANAPLSANPFSVSATYKAGVLAAMAAYERNAAETTIWSVAGSAMATKSIKLVASYQKQDQGHTMASNALTKAWVMGANFDVSSGTFLLGYGQKSPEGQATTKQLGLGYEHNLSKRTYLYVDASNKKAAKSVNFFGVGIQHKF